MIWVKPHIKVDKNNSFLFHRLSKLKRISRKIQRSLLFIMKLLIEFQTFFMSNFK
jgi:hypothetical protein